MYAIEFGWIKDSIQQKYYELLQKRKPLTQKRSVTQKKKIGTVQNCESNEIRHFKLRLSINCIKDGVRYRSLKQYFYNVRPGKYCIYIVYNLVFPAVNLEE